MTMQVPETCSPTAHFYVSLDKAYLHLDASLFGGELRDAALITLQRRARCRSYFSWEKFASRSGGGPLNEIALNPKSFHGMSDEEVLAQLVHEMVHLRQHLEGCAARRGYHNTNWADTMEALGLTPTATGALGGPRTGESVTQLIAPGGRFEKACKELLSGGRRIVRFEDRLNESSETRRETKTASQIRFACPTCTQEVRGAPSSFVLCGECRVVMKPTEGQR